MSHSNQNRKQTEPKTVTFDKGIELLPVGATVTLEISRSEILQEKYKSQYIGCQPEHALLFKMPSFTKAKHPELLQESNIMTVRGLSTQGEGAIIAFRCTILRHYAPPFAMLAVSIPEKIQIHLLRNEPRFSLDLHASINVNGKVYEGGLADISISGCCFCSDEMPILNKEDAVTIEVHHELENNNYTFKGVVRNQRKINNVFMIGMSFACETLTEVESMLQEIILKGSR